MDIYAAMNRVTRPAERMPTKGTEGEQAKAPAPACPECGSDTREVEPGVVFECIANAGHVTVGAGAVREALARGTKP